MNNYQIYPYRFLRFNKTHSLLINDIGDWILLENNDFDKFTKGNLDINSNTAQNLQSKDFLTPRYLASDLKRLAHRYRTKKKYLFDSTALHMLVMTHRCNQQCLYCQASSHKTSGNDLDMSIETAKKCIDVAFESPSEYLKIEFQGGEPLLNKKTIFETVAYAKSKNIENNKKLEFVICTNLLNLDPQIIEFLHQNNDVQISTSLDGPRQLHDKCRISHMGVGTYNDFIRKLTLFRKNFSKDRIAALSTISKYNLYKMKELVDIYKELSFDSIFLRPLNPFGFALKKWEQLAYPIEEFIQEYCKTLDYIIDLNKKGYFLREEFACIFLSKIHTPYSSNFVDIQSPSGLGIAGAIYEINGDVFLSDEARMLYRGSGNKTYCLGNACTQSRNTIYSNPILKKILLKSTIEALPGCAWCAFQPYCGTDPIKNYVKFNDEISLKYNDDNCQLYHAIIMKLFRILLSKDEESKKILYSWINEGSQNMLCEEENETV